MKKIYKIYAHFMGKDLNKVSLLGVVLAESDKEVAELINVKMFDYRPEHPDEEGWANLYGYANLKDIIKNKGDVGEEYMGEFYDIKYSWEEVCEATEEIIESINKLGIEIKEYGDFYS